METVTITKIEYEKLQIAYYKLMALEEQGVDKWKGYSFAISYFEMIRKEHNI